MQRLIAGLTLLVLCTPALVLAQSPVEVQSRVINPALPGISWQAIIAGAIVVLVVQLTLSILGVGIGAAAIDPYDRKNPAKGVPTGAMLWIVISGLIALFVGGWTAGRLANVPLTDSTIHGVLTWGVASIATFCLLTSSISFLVGGMIRVLGEGASLVGKTAATVLPGAANLAKEAVKELAPELDWTKIKGEAEKMIRETQKKHLLPENLSKLSDQAASEVRERAHKIMDNPLEADKEIGELITKAYSAIRDGLPAGDRESLVNLFTERTGMKKEDVNKTIDGWENSYKEAKVQLRQLEARVEQQAREAADATATAISRIALWTFASLLLGLAAAAIGGRMGSRPIAERTETAETISPPLRSVDAWVRRS